MLLRFYRLSDKLGIIILKLAAAFGDFLADSAAMIVHAVRRSTGSVFGLILTALIRLLGLLGLFFNGIWSLLKAFAGILAKLLGGGVNLVGRAGSSVLDAGVRTASDTMARRAARDEIDVTLKEDPLRVQNRRLSFLVLFLGAIVIAALIWATDPNRNTQTPVIAFNPPDNNPSQQDNNTPVATNIAANVGGAATPIPTATALPEALRARGSIVYTVRERTQTDLWAINVGSVKPIRITNDPADERDPEWNADGTRLAYASRASGNWDLYVYDILVDAHQRLTVDLSFQANPTWSPDGVYLAYENYQGENLDIYAVKIDGTQAPQQITVDPDPNVPVADFSPAWGPSGRQIAFVSWRDGSQDIFIFDLDSLATTNISNTPNINEDYPVWSPNGRFIAYSAWEQGSEKVFVKSTDDPNLPPQVLAFGRTPTWSPDGGSIAFVVDAMDGSRTDISAVTFGEGRVPIQIASVPYGSSSLAWSSVSLPPQLLNAGGLALGLTDELYVEQAASASGDDFQLQSLGNVQTENPLLSDAVNDSFDALRQRIFETSGVDFLDQLDHAFWPLERPQDLGEAPRNWHRTGRAFSITENSIRGFPPPIEVVREDVDLELYWRIYLRVDENSQRGQLGEPLRRMPWDFLSTTQGDIEAFNQGGRLRRQMPAGYYIDFTQLAQDYGWQRIPVGSDWRGNTRARNYWMFIKTDGLIWCDAMLQLYTEGELINYACTESG
jgi:TolB protein